MFYGLPKQVFVDAGTNLNSKEFLEWGEAWGCRIHCAPPECQYQNGTVERGIRTLKLALKVITAETPKLSFEKNTI